MVKIYTKWVQWVHIKGQTEYKRRDMHHFYNYGTKTSAAMKRHKVKCPARSAKCYNCQRIGHVSKFCKTTKNIRKVEEKIETDQDMKDIYEKVDNVNLFRITTQNILKNQYHGNFKVEVVVNSTLAAVIADTGAKVNVCSLQ